ncbi:MAG: NADH-quinone oxidoreductase subunit [Thermoleophilaceae bacterium]|jgi:NADH-quinone oxidoreductase subunit N|nr:NADH-quinone oxidoreductase subunit [Thermoleophilaceae bacterium]
MTLPLADIQAPDIDYKALSPLIATIGGSIVVLMVGLLRGRRVQTVLVPALTAVSLLTAIGLAIWTWEPGVRQPIIEGSLTMDTLTLGIAVLVYVAGLVAVALSLRAVAAREAGHGEYHSMLLGSITGMVLLAASSDLITLFVGLELLSIPLYVLCATELHRRTSLEAGLKYLVIGSVGSATLLYGLALIYGATGAMQFDAIASAISSDQVSLTDPLLLTGIALLATGLAFKASVAPFHQWTPDVYQGAPTPITTFMAVATKAAAFGIFLRLFDHALGLSQLQWGPALAALATATIVIGNVGALAQRSLKRLLAWSSVAQAGYLLAGVVVGSTLGLQATVFYLAVYLVMNVAAFAVVIARERVSERGDDLSSLENLGQTQPWLAWPMTIAMLSLAGVPATAGFIGKFYLIDAAVAGDYAWLGVVIVVGAVVSFAYYLRVVAVMWMGGYEVELPTVPPRKVKPVSGWSPEADLRAQPEVAAIAIAFAALTILFGIWPDPLFDAARDIGTALSGLR